MGNWIRVVGLAVAWAVSAAGAAAQTLTVPKNLTAGHGITIGYSDPGRAGQTVTITIDNAGFPTLVVIELQVTLDAQGNGSVEWMVPEWLAANFNAPDVPEQTRDIDLLDLPIFVANEPAALQA